MKIYEYHNADHQAYLYAEEGVSELCDPRLPEPLSAGWSPPTFELVTDDEFEEGMPKTDFLTFLMTTMFLSRRAVDRLGPILHHCGEVLPIRLSNDDEEAFLFNVTRVIDAIDMKRSKFMRFPDGGIMKVERLELDPTKIPREPLFFKTTQLGPVTEIYATEAAVQAVEDANLTGHDFRLAWSDE